RDVLGHPREGVSRARVRATDAGSGHRGHVGHRVGPGANCRLSRRAYTRTMARELPIFDPNPSHGHAPATDVSIAMGGGRFEAAADATVPLRRHPDWIKARLPSGENYHDLKGLLRGLNLN